MTLNRHPGLDPGSIFFKPRDEEERWIPDQVRHDGCINLIPVCSSKARLARLAVPEVPPQVTEEPRRSRRRIAAASGRRVLLPLALHRVEEIAEIQIAAVEGVDRQLAAATDAVSAPRLVEMARNRLFGDAQSPGYLPIRLSPSDQLDAFQLSARQRARRRSCLAEAGGGTMSSGPVGGGLLRSCHNPWTVMQYTLQYKLPKVRKAR